MSFLQNLFRPRDQSGQQSTGRREQEGGGVGNSARASQVAGNAAWQQVAAGQKLLRRGSRGAAVEALQQYLVQHGQQVTVDGFFGRGTERAVRAVQAQLGVSVDGIVGGGMARALAGGGGGPATAPGDRSSTQREDSAARDTENAATSLDEINVSAGSFERTGLRRQVFSKALTAFETAWKNGETDRLIFTVIDYELHSSKKRLWVIDLSTGDLLFHEHTSHGKGSDANHDGYADRMSNVNGSGTSNVGLLKTAETYYGKHGYSMRMDGLEQGFNHNARRRAIVMHSAAYADDGYRNSAGKMGRSLGCPALDPDVSGDIIRTIQGGTLVFGYYPDPEWLRRSKYLDN